MNQFLVNIVLALVWGAVTTSFAPGNLLFGFVLGFFSLWLVRDRFNPRNFNRPGRALAHAAAEYDIPPSHHRPAAGGPERG